MSIQSFQNTNCTATAILLRTSCTTNVTSFNPDCRSLVGDTLTGFCAERSVNHWSEQCRDFFFTGNVGHICSSLPLNDGQCGTIDIIPCSADAFREQSQRWKSAYSSAEDGSWSTVTKKIAGIAILLLLGTGAIANCFIK